MNKPAIHRFETPELVARAVAQIIAEASQEKAWKGQSLSVALSGGSTPKLLFDMLATEFKEAVAWESLRLFWVDERCVPPENAESNYGMTAAHLLSRVAISQENIFRMQGEALPDDEAVRYAALLEKELPQTDGVPRFDIVLLGMGDDGHTASIFPDNRALLTSDSLVAVATHPQSGQKRITLTGRVLNTADKRLFLITGASKAVVLKQIMSQSPEAERYPAFYIERAAFYLDNAAAQVL